jgi:hypothetical protein
MVTDMDLDGVRRLAMALPGTTEQPHHQMTSFRVAQRIYATAPPEGTHAHVFLDEHQSRAYIASEPGLEELWWGKRRTGVRIRLAEAADDVVAELLEASWRRRAPELDVAAWDARHA